MPGQRRLWISTLVGALALVAVPSASPAQDPEAPEAGVRCVAVGYDVIVRNEGAGPLASGTEIGWSVPFLRKQGSHVLTRDLDPDGSVFVSAALGSTYLVDEKPCEASLGSG